MFQVSRIRLRGRVVWLTIAFGCALLLITFVLTFQAKEGQKPAKLVFKGSKSVSVDIPFTLKDVKLP